jgi:hypothetical protein
MLVGGKALASRHEARKSLGRPCGAAVHASRLHWLELVTLVTGVERTLLAQFSVSEDDYDFLIPSPKTIVGRPRRKMTRPTKDLVMADLQVVTHFRRPRSFAARIKAERQKQMLFARMIGISPFIEPNAVQRAKPVTVRKYMRIEIAAVSLVRATFKACGMKLTTEQKEAA